VTESSTGAYTGGGSADAEQSTVKQAATQGTQAAGQAVSDVRSTAADQAQRVGAEARTQARTVVSDVRDKLGEQARTQNDRLVGTIRQTADHLDEMRGDRDGTPAATVVQRVADGGRQLADYLDQHGPEGVLREVQDFARRRPGAFLATALAAGFVVGRLGKSVAKADPNAGSSGKPDTDTYASGYPQTGTGYQTPGYQTPDYQTGGYQTGGYQATGTDYPESTTYVPDGGVTTTSPTAQPPATPASTGYETSGTEYASTGTGTPLVIEEEYPATGPETRP
jgi:hypothetical protein